MGVKRNEQGMCLGRQKEVNNKEIITIKHTEGQHLVSGLFPRYSVNITKQAFYNGNKGSDCPDITG